MKISLWAIGKNHEPYIKEGTEEFTKRISRYFSIDWNIIPVPKNAAMLSEMDLKKKEGEIDDRENKNNVGRGPVQEFRPHLP